MTTLLFMIHANHTMNRTVSMTAQALSIVAWLICLGSASVCAEDHAKALELTEEFQSLLQEDSLAGWSVDTRRIPDGGQDGEQMFSVSGKVIHVYAGAEHGSKQTIGVITTDQAFSEYVFGVDYQWLGSRFAPRQKADRDAGVLFHVAAGKLAKVYPPSVECQIGESKPGGPYVAGDLWVLGENVRVQALQKGNKYASRNDGGSFKTLGAKPYIPSRTPIAAAEPGIKKWHTVRVVVKADQYAIFQINDRTVNEIAKMEHAVDGDWVPLKEGRISLQSEYAELVYRDPRIRKILSSDAKPAGPDRAQ